MFLFFVQKHGVGYSNILILHFLQKFCTTFSLTIMRPCFYNGTVNTPYWSVMHKIQRKSTKIIGFSEKKILEFLKTEKSFAKKSCILHH